MDYFNDIYPLHPPNPDTTGLSDSEASERNEIIEKIISRKRKHKINFDDFCMIYSSELWSVWHTIKENCIYSGLLNNLDYHGFCVICYENTS